MERQAYSLGILALSYGTAWVSYGWRVYGYKLWFGIGIPPLIVSGFSAYLLVAIFG